MKKAYNTANTYEMGLDEAGRGPLFGRVYAAAVILPQNESFRHDMMKDSKKFSSSKKLKETAEYIKQNAIAYAVSYEESDVIDHMNILNATIKCMHSCIRKIKTQPDLLLVDGNHFKSYCIYSNEYGIISIPHVCIKSGDNQYTSIAAASILAKVERDAYIDELCNTYSLLSEYYGLDKNKGYGTKQHMDGIEQYGITPWHRKSFRPCKNKQIITSDKIK